MTFSRFQKPSRYIDSEYNVIRKGPAGLSMALCFPDVYEVGMSHLGLKILYDIANALPFVSAERAFAPWTDLREHLKKTGEPLRSLESEMALRDFDIVGMSLQYELCYTTVLDMLDLGGIPLRSLNRLDAGGPMPLVIAGGPSTVNPAPMAPFIDAFLIGDGEEAMVELLEAVRDWKDSGSGREKLLRRIAAIEGFYVPLHHGPDDRVRRRFIDDLENAPFPVKPLVPYLQIVHDRIAVEVARGCTKGCRFCQAGMIYRPLRHRSPKKVIELVDRSLRSTGYEEVSFVSLSTGDYPHLLPLIKEFNRRYSGSKIAASLPSLRVGSVCKEVLHEIKSVRKTGFTMAPEAATERLRQVINKDFTDENYERALAVLFEEGWLSLKLYFMIGLPTERQEDIEAINEMAMKALRMAKRNTGKFVNVNITVSPFVPKPHTPFQWCGQLNLDEMRRTLRYLKQSINAKKFKYKGHNEEMSFLEAIFARGDDRLADLIEEAWRSGCRLDGWTECFDFAKWQAAMEKTGIDGASYAERTFGRDEALPWDMIDVGVTKRYLQREYDRAVEAAKTADCEKACTGCGLGCRSEGAAASTSAPGVDEDLFSGLTFLPSKPRYSTVRARVRFSKSGKLRYLSHLEVVSAIMRALRRAGVPIDYTKGFHPKPLVSFGPPLSVGVAGEREYFDMEVFTPFDVQFYSNAMNMALPEGLSVAGIVLVPQSEASLTGFITRYEYLVACTDQNSARPVPPVVGAAIPARRDEGEVDLSPCILKVEPLDPEDDDVRIRFGDDAAWACRLLLQDTEKVRIRLGEIMETLFGLGTEDLAIVRTGLYGLRGDWKEPL